MDTRRIGKSMAALRKTNGYTQETLAEKLGISSQAVSKWETGAGLPEASLLVELSTLLHTSIDEILRPGQPRNVTASFMERNFALPEQQLLAWIPRVSRWKPPAGCDMWYSFPAMLSEALCSVEAHDAGLTEISYTQLNERFCDLMHITGVGYGFLWNTVKPHIIEELWHINNIEEMVAQAMRYYGRDYLWLTSDNATPDEMRRAIMWSVARGRPAVMEWAGGIPEFSVVTGYEQGGNALIGYTHCEECATKTNEYGMFVNPARWDDDFAFRVLVIGDKIEPAVTDSDTIAYALQVLDKTSADDREFALTHEFIAGDAALQAWLTACDTVEHTAAFFTFKDIYSYALFQNTIYTQKCILSFYKNLAQRCGRPVHDVVCQITIAVNRITDERSSLDKLKKHPAKYAAACRQHIENLLQYRRDLRGWLRELAAQL